MKGIVKQSYRRTHIQYLVKQPRGNILFREEKSEMAGDILLSLSLFFRIELKTFSLSGLFHLFFVLVISLVGHLLSSFLKLNWHLNGNEREREMKYQIDLGGP